MNQTLKTTNSLIRSIIKTRSSVKIILDNQINNNNNNNCLNNRPQIRTITRGRVNVLREMKKRARDFDAVPHKERHRREWFDWNYDCEIYAFNNRLKEKFDEYTLKKAFIFKSYTEQQQSLAKDDQQQRQQNNNDQLDLITQQIDLENNQEFIDSGIELCQRFISCYLRYFLPNTPEEGISEIKKWLLSTESLSDMANKIGCKDLIVCAEFPVEKETLADTMYSLIGALKHDVDEKHAIKFIIDFVLTYLNSVDIMDIWSIEKPEELARQILKANNLDDYEYRILRQTGINTLLPSYLIGVYCNKKLLGYGPGSSIDEAKQMASYDCLRRIFNLTVPHMMYEFGEKAYNIDYDQYSKPNQSADNFKIEQLNERFK